MALDSPFDFSNPIFNDLTAAREALEAVRWPHGPVCPHCGDVERVARIQGPSARPGLLFCNACKGQFTVTVGTVFERSKVPLTKWWAAAFMLSSGKKGVSAHEIHRTLGVTYKTAWFMMHRLREAMRDLNPGPIGGFNKTVEVDETFVGGKAPNRKSRKVPPKEAVLAAVEREGKVRGHHIGVASSATVAPILNRDIDKRSYLITDESPLYPKAGQQFAGHGTVNHSKEEYVRAGFWHTNTAENYFSIFKRGIIGVYHHVSAKHLKRYVTEFDFRYNQRMKLGVDDRQRTIAALKGIEGKRLTYRRTRGEQAT